MPEWARKVTGKIVKSRELTRDCGSRAFGNVDEHDLVPVSLMIKAGLPAPAAASASLTAPLQKTIGHLAIHRAEAAAGDVCIFSDRSLLRASGDAQPLIIVGKQVRDCPCQPGTVAGLHDTRCVRRSSAGCPTLVPTVGTPATAASSATSGPASCREVTTSRSARSKSGRMADCGRNPGKLTGQPTPPPRSVFAIHRHRQCPRQPDPSRRRYPLPSGARPHPET